MRYMPTARQDSLFGCPYKFIIDACSIISQNPNSTYPRHIYVGLWEAIDDLVNRHEIVTCKQIASEVSSGKNDDISKRKSRWARASASASSKSSAALGQKRSICSVAS